MSQRDVVHLEQVRSSAGNKTREEAENPNPNSTAKQKSKNKLETSFTFTPEPESEPTSTSTAPVRENWGWSGQSPMIQKMHYLLTKETFSMAVKIFRLGAFIKIVPFQLVYKNGESLRVRPFEKKWQWALWHLVTWTIFAATAFEFISFFFLWQRSSFGKEMAFHIMYLVLSAWIFVFFLSLYLNPKACIVMLNHHDEIMRNSSRLGLSRKHWASYPFVILSVYYLAWAFIMFDSVFVIFYLRNPERSQYIYSGFPASWKKDDVILYGCCAVVEFLWMGCGFLLINLFFCYWCAQIYTFNGSQNELLKRQNFDEGTIESYLSLQLFCNSFNCFNGGLFDTGFCSLLFITPVLFVYLSLTTFHMLSIVVFLSSPVFASVTIGLITLFLPQHSKVQIKAVNVLQRFTHLPIGAKRVSSNIVDISHLPEEQRRGYLRRRVKAFRRLGIQIWFFGAFTLDTSAVMMDQIINNVILLLSL